MKTDDHFYCMPNDEHIAILNQGVDVWNRWRIDHPTIQPALRGVALDNRDLAHINLSNAELPYANLNGARFYKANLLGANLFEIHGRAHFSHADLSRANLCRADLSGARAFSTDFRGATLTAACIDGWQINKKTQFDGVRCEYVFLQKLWIRYQERRPIDGTFSPDEFERIVFNLPYGECKLL
jgi:hypothetical protein